jgi:hypothetical protein
MARRERAYSTQQTERIVSFPDTYSQYDEQQAILAWFDSDKRVCAAKEGRFLDIGAWDPKCFSNTRALYERGWSGVLIEPSPGPLISLLKEYGNEPRIKIVQGAVSTEFAQPITLRVTDDSITSVAGSATHQLWKEKGGYYGDMTVMPIDWEHINLWFGGFQFVNIDAEGLSVDLFKAMLASGQMPDCACVELDGRMTELCEAATKAGYKLLYSNQTNGVFGR